jgi:hypothetical protein
MGKLGLSAAAFQAFAPDAALQNLHVFVGSAHALLPV